MAFKPRPTLPLHTPCPPQSPSGPTTTGSPSLRLQPACLLLCFASRFTRTKRSHVLISSAFKVLLVPTHYLSDKSEFFFCGSMALCIFIGHVYTLCYSHTFLISRKILIQAKGLWVSPASPPCPAQASSHS